MDGYSPEENAQLTEIEKSLLPFYGKPFLYITVTRERREVTTPALRTIYGTRINQSSPAVFKEEDAYKLSRGKISGIAYNPLSWEMEIKNSPPSHTSCSLYLPSVQIIDNGGDGLLLWNGNLPSAFWQNNWNVNPRVIDAFTLWDKYIPLDTRVVLIGDAMDRFLKAGKNPSQRIEKLFARILPSLKGVTNYLKQIKAKTEVKA